MKQVSLNFGAIKDTIYRYAPKQLLEGSKETVLGTFVKTLKECRISKVQYFIFKNLVEGRCKSERLAERFINQNLNLLEGISFDKILNKNREVRVGLLENAHVEGEKGNEELYENIHALIQYRTSGAAHKQANLTKSEESFDFVLNHLLRAEESPVAKSAIEESETPKLLSWKYVTKLAVDNFNERYGHLNESEQELLQLLMSPEDKKRNYLQDLKNENATLIDKLYLTAEEETKSALENFKTRLPEIDGIENLDEAILNCAELRDCLKEIK